MFSKLRKKKQEAVVPDSVAEEMTSFIGKAYEPYLRDRKRVEEILSRSILARDEALAARAQTAAVLDKGFVLVTPTGPHFVLPGFDYYVTFDGGRKGGRFKVESVRGGETGKPTAILVPVDGSPWDAGHRGDIYSIVPAA